MNLKIKIYDTIILPVVLYGCETWSLTLRVFENRILRRIFVLRRLRLRSGEGSTINNFDLYHSPNKVRVIKSRRLMDRACSQNRRK
jgi:hypothetical protein